MTDVDLARALERREVPSAGFHHADHLRVSLVYLNESPSVDAAVGRMASTLRAFAASVGKPEKFSQPMTEFWMYQMAAARSTLPGADCDTLTRAFPHLLDKTLYVDARPADSPRDPSHRPVPH
jgi:hypothetical protein